MSNPVDPDQFEFGLNSFGEIASDGGQLLGDAEMVRLLVEEAQLAESVGIDVFSIGEHYRDDFVDTAPPVLLGAIAQATDSIRLSTSVTVLSTRDPVRLYHEYATVDALSNGRAEMVLGRASSLDSFSLFGYELSDYQELFTEKLDLFLRLIREERVTWSGKHRTSLDNVHLRPRMREGGVPTWIGVGGNPESVLRAARNGLPLMMAIIGGRPERFSRHAELYLQALSQFGKPRLPIGQHSMGFVADTDEEAAEQYWDYWHWAISEAHSQGGFYAPSREKYAQEIETGAWFVGSVETVAQKIARVARANQLSRFDLKYDGVNLPRDARAKSIRLFGEQVAPRVRELLHENQ